MQRLLGTFKGMLTEESLRRAGFEIDTKYYDKGFTNKDSEIVEFEDINRNIELTISDDPHFDYMDSKGLYYQAHWFEKIEEPISGSTYTFAVIAFISFIFFITLYFNIEGK
jgi:hypothetical protein